MSFNMHFLHMHSQSSPALSPLWPSMFTPPLAGKGCQSPENYGDSWCQVPGTQSCSRLLPLGSGMTSRSAYSSLDADSNTQKSDHTVRGGRTQICSNLALLGWDGLKSSARKLLSKNPKICLFPEEKNTGKAQWNPLHGHSRKVRHSRQQELALSSLGRAAVSPTKGLPASFSHFTGLIPVQNLLRCPWSNHFNVFSQDGVDMKVQGDKGG